MTGKKLFRSLGEIDPKMIEEAAPIEKEKAVGLSSGKEETKRNQMIKRAAAVAACIAVFALIIPLGIGNWQNRGSVPTIPVEPETSAEETEKPMPPETKVPETNDAGAPTPETEVPETKSPETEIPETKAPETKVPETKEPETKAPGEADPQTEVLETKPEDSQSKLPTADWAFTSCISDPRYENYELSSPVLRQELVGELIGDIRVTLSYGQDREDTTAKVYRVVGVDSDLILCIRYVKEETGELFQPFIDFESAQFLCAKSYSFDTLSSLRGAFGKHLRVDVLPDFFSLYSTEKESLLVNPNAKEEIIALLSSELDGKRDDLQNGITLNYLEEAGEFLITSLSWESDLGLPIPGNLRIFDSGYLYHSAFGGQLFDIGEENAKKLIALFTDRAIGQQYSWIDRDGKDYPVIYDDAADYSSFLMALEENKLTGRLWFREEVRYFEDCFGFSYHELTLSEKALAAIAETLYEADGPAVKDAEIPGYPPEEQLFHPKELLTLTQDRGNGETLTISVYDSGHIKLNGVYYYVGTFTTRQIMDTLHMEHAELFR